LKEKGKVTRGWLGVYIQPLTPEAAEGLGISERRGALVSDVTSGGPAEKAGIRSGDVIVEFNGREIRDEHELPQAVALTKPGKTVNVRLIRGGKETTVAVTIAEMAGEPGKPAGEQELSKNFGLTVQDITPEIAHRFEIENTKGVVVTGVADGSPAEDAGFNEGDIIRTILRQDKRNPVTNAAEFAKLVKKFESDNTILFLVERGASRILLTVKIK
jgi:serine protease Do